MKDAIITLVAVMLAVAAFDDITTDRDTSFVALLWSSRPGACAQAR